MKKYFFTLAMALMSMVAMAQDAPTGKPIITLFGNFHSGIDQAVYNDLGFEIDRAYLGYQLNYNENWSAKVVYDMGEKSDGAVNQRIGFLKNAMVGYKNGNLQLNVGLTDCEAFTFQQNFWGYRYLYKSFMDKNGWDNSADLGIVGKYSFSNWFSADLSIFNGEGFKKLQLDNQLLYGLGLTFNPIQGLYVRAYGEVKTGGNGEGQELVSAFVGYKHQYFRIGAEYNRMANCEYAKGHNLSGYSIYGTGIINSKMEIFARYDNGVSSDEANNVWSYGKNGQAALLGLQYKVNRLVSLSPNFRWSKAEGGDDHFYGYLSAQVKF